MEFNLISVVAGGLMTLVGFLISVSTFTRNRDKEISANASQQAVIISELTSIKTGIDSMRVDMKVEQKERQMLNEKVIRVEESVSSAHKRIDRLEDKE